jgi:hypothetical protein
MANNFWITQACAKAMMDAFNAQVDVGTAAVITIFDGVVPATADTALSSNNVLAQLTCSATAFGAATTAHPSVVTAAAIASDTSADSTGTASFFRIFTQSDNTTPKAQGTAGVGSFDLNLNTTAFTSGSTVAITSATVSLPCGA